MIVVFLSDIHGVNAQKRTAWEAGLLQQCKAATNLSFCFISPYDALTEDSEVQTVEPSYESFQQYIGLDRYLAYCQRKIAECVAGAPSEAVVIVGESVGATTAWRLSADLASAGLAERNVTSFALYGSRIRDYMSLQPQCACTAIFSEDEAYFVDDFHAHHNASRSVLTSKIEPFKHGFLSPSHEAFECSAFHAFIKALAAMLSNR